MPQHFDVVKEGEEGEEEDTMNGGDDEVVCNIHQHNGNGDAAGDDDDTADPVKKYKEQNKKAKDDDYKGTVHNRYVNTNKRIYSIHDQERSNARQRTQHNAKAEQKK